METHALVFRISDRPGLGSVPTIAYGNLSRRCPPLPSRSAILMTVLFLYVVRPYFDPPLDTPSYAL